MTMLTRAWHSVDATSHSGNSSRGRIAVVINGDRVVVNEQDRNRLVEHGAISSRAMIEKAAMRLIAGRSSLNLSQAATRPWDGHGIAVSLVARRRLSTLLYGASAA